MSSSAESDRNGAHRNSIMSGSSLGSAEDSLIRLHVFPDPWGINPSPFCLKVETYCRLAGIPFRAVTSLPFRAPRGKLPFIDDGEKRIPDSGLIIEYLKQRHGDPLDRKLDSEQVTKGLLIRRTCEESLYFVLLYSRWIDPVGWNIVRPAFFGSLPVVVRDAAAAVARRGVKRALHGQGYGRHSASEVHAIGAVDLSALAAAIARSVFAVSDRPTSYDATLYGLLANILSVPVETALKSEACRHASLIAYVERMRSEIAMI
jgi:glutathione S-transferase